MSPFLSGFVKSNMHVIYSLLISLMLNIMWLLYHFHIRALHLALSAKDRTT